MKKRGYKVFSVGRRWNRFFHAFMYLLTMGLTAALAQSDESTLAVAKPTITFGVVIDGTSVDLEDRWLLLLKDEIHDLLASEFNVRFPEEKTLLSDWEPARIGNNVDNLLTDPAVDMVIAMGVLSTLEAATRGAFDKPVIGTAGINADLPVYPLENGSSGVANFTYLIAPPRIANHLSMMKRLKPVDRVHFVVFEPIASLVPGLVNFVDQLFAEQDLDVVYVLAHDSVDGIMAAIPDDARMVYVTPMLRFSKDQKRELYRRLAAKQVASFAMLGREEVELGALAGLAPKSDILRWARRAALNIQRILLGEDPADLPVLLDENSKLTLNMATARAIDWYPRWDIQIAADLLNERPEPNGRQLTMAAAVHEALRVNLGYQAAQQDVAIGAQQVREREAARRPQLDTAVTGIVVDEDTAAASFGSQAERTVRGSLDLEQVVYADGVHAGIDIARHVQRSREHALTATKLDLALDVSSRFLNYLQAQTLSRIRQNNLDLTNANLETAETRTKIGIASRAEVYRWQSQVARDQQLAIQAKAQEEAALVQLNLVLHFSQEARLDAIAPAMGSPEYMTGEGRLRAMVDNEQSFARFRSFMVVEGLRNAPELKQLDALIAAKKRAVTSGQRAFYLPTVAVQAGLEHDFTRDGNAALPNIPGMAFPEMPDTRWNAAINLSIPIFDGGTRKAQLGRARLELEQLQQQRRYAAEQIEANIRATLHLVGSANVAIDLFRQSAAAARENYELVKDAYAKGVANSTDLLDAQNAALTAEQASANAMYDFFLQLMRFQRAASNFDFFIDASDRKDFYQRLEAFYQQFD